MQGRYRRRDHLALRPPLIFRNHRPLTSLSGLARMLALGLGLGLALALTLTRLCRLPRPRRLRPLQPHVGRRRRLAAARGAGAACRGTTAERGAITARQARRAHRAPPRHLRRRKHRPRTRSLRGGPTLTLTLTLTLSLTLSLTLNLTHASPNPSPSQAALRTLFDGAADYHPSLLARAAAKARGLTLTERYPRPYT